MFMLGKTKYKLDIKKTGIVLLTLMFVCFFPANVKADSCMSFSERANLYSKCSMCEVFGDIFDAVSETAALSYNQIAPGGQGLIWVGALLWLILMLMKYLSSLQAIDPADFWKSASIQFFNVVVGIAILSQDVQYVFSWFVEPIVVGAFEFSNAVVGGSCVTDTSVVGTGAFSPGVRDAMVCSMKALRSELLEGLVVGGSLMCLAFNDARIKWGPIKLPNGAMALQGFTIYIIVAILLFAFPFYLVDALFKLGVAASLVPILVPAWVFKTTRGYTGKGWSMLLSALMTFVMMAFVLAIDVQMIGGVFGSWSEVIDAINHNKIDVLMKTFTWSGNKIPKLLAVGIFAFAMIQKAEAIAEHFAGQLGWSSMGAELGGNAVKMANRHGGALAGAALSGAGSILGAATGGAKRAGRNLRAGIVEKNVQSKLDQSNSDISSLDKKMQGMQTGSGEHRKAMRQMQKLGKKASSLNLRNDQLKNRKAGEKVGSRAKFNKQAKNPFEVANSIEKAIEGTKNEVISRAGSYANVDKYKSSTSYAVDKAVESQADRTQNYQDARQRDRADGTGHTQRNIARLQNKIDRKVENSDFRDELRNDRGSEGLSDKEVARREARNDRRRQRDSMEIEKLQRKIKEQEAVRDHVKGLYSKENEKKEILDMAARTGSYQTTKSILKNQERIEKLEKDQASREEYGLGRSKNKDKKLNNLKKQLEKDQETLSNLNQAHGIKPEKEASLEEKQKRARAQEEKSQQARQERERNERLKRRDKQREKEKEEEKKRKDERIRRERIRRLEKQRQEEKEKEEKEVKEKKERRRKEREKTEEKLEEEYKKGLKKDE